MINNIKAINILQREKLNLQKRYIKASEINNTDLMGYLKNRIEAHNIAITSIDVSYHLPKSTEPLMIKENFSNNIII